VVIRRVVLARLFRATSAAMLLLAGQAAMAAQEVTRFEDLPLRLNTGDQVTIETRSGGSVAGRVVRMGPEQIAVTGPDARERVFAAAEVERVRRRGDGLSNGVRIGAIAGGVAGCALGGLFSGEFRAADCMQGGLIFAAAGAGLGLALDAMHTGATTVFQAPTARARWRPWHDGVGVPRPCRGSAGVSRGGANEEHGVSRCLVGRRRRRCRAARGVVLTPARRTDRRGSGAVWSIGASTGRTTAPVPPVDGLGRHRRAVECPPP
jgi:hypothetical protein